MEGAADEVPDSHDEAQIDKTAFTPTQGAHLSGGSLASSAHHIHLQHLQP